jgi:hypothetical protein
VVSPLLSRRYETMIISGSEIHLRFQPKSCIFSRMIARINLTLTKKIEEEEVVVGVVFNYRPTILCHYPCDTHQS